jgi:hypothetical protein
MESVVHPFHRAPYPAVLLAAWLIAASPPPAALADPSPPPNVFSLSTRNLMAARARLAQGDAALAPARDRLQADAADALRFKPVSVMDKERLPPSGDRHDYLSQAPYWWPDPATPDGRPYVCHDGRHNPEADRGTDAGPWARTAGHVETLGLAYYFTGRAEYAEHAVRLIRVWFLDPATRMNPNLRFAQYVPGRNNGRGTGILEMRHLNRVCDALALIAEAHIWTEADAQAFRAWLDAYFTWLTQSQAGKDEAAALNNHGSWYAVQMAHLALVLGRTDLARTTLIDGLQKRLARQIEPDGRQPLELARTKSLGYSLFNLEALFNLARLGEHVGVDWWAYRTDDGRSLRAALSQLAPYVDPAKPWIKRDILPANRADLLPLLAEALQYVDDPEWRSLLAGFGGIPEVRSARWHLLLSQ